MESTWWTNYTVSTVKCFGACASTPGKPEKYLENDMEYQKSDKPNGSYTLHGTSTGTGRAQ